MMECPFCENTIPVVGADVAALYERARQYDITDFGIDRDLLATALHRWKTEREGDPTPHTDWWATRCHDCKDDADRIISNYISGAASGPMP